MTTQLQNLRALMQERNISALIVPGTDPHASEYIAKHWQERKYISSFSGSAGTAVITLNGGCLWTDSRYFLQAEEQLRVSELELQKEGLADTPDIATWLGCTLKKGDTIAINPQMFSIDGFNSLQTTLSSYGINLNTNFDLINEVWNDRPAMPTNKAFLLNKLYAGADTTQKLNALRINMDKRNINTVLLTALDDIAWLFNLRGNDIQCNPVAIAFAIVYKHKATLFINPDKLDEETRIYLNTANVDWKEYDEIYAELKNLPETSIIGIDFSKANQSLYQAVPCACQIVNTPSIVFQMKAIKNGVEISGTRNAMVKDGVALTRFFRWLEKELPSGGVSELSVIEHLRACREEQDEFFTDSFETIAGYAHHGAIVHYRADKQSNIGLKEENFLLLDSGGQYLHGTTDITRTVALGELTEEQKADYTFVLKGHLALSAMTFPHGTRGAQLDAIARQFLWNNSRQYGHGTGHGIGHFLNVHEGPQSIRMDENPTILEVGMMMSNEPGLYRTDKYGIRIENIITVIEKEENEFGRFLCFETLTLFPYDLNSIDTTLLSAAEIEQINKYHRKVFSLLSPSLTEEEVEWLKYKTREI